MESPTGKEEERGRSPEEPAVIRSEGCQTSEAAHREGKTPREKFHQESVASFSHAPTYCRTRVILAY